MYWPCSSNTNPTSVMIPVMISGMVGFMFDDAFMLMFKNLGVISSFTLLVRACYGFGASKKETPYTVESFH